MKPYGHSKKDIGFVCPYGCCTGQSDKRRNCRGKRDRTRRKAERQDATRDTEFRCQEIDTHKD